MNYRKLLPEKISWSLLYTFLIIVEEKSISLAAIRLNLTQSAVSQSLKKLEKQMSVQLIERHHKRFNLTEQGKILYKTAADIYKQIISLDHLLNDQATSISDTLTLFMLSRVASENFDDFLVFFHRRYPQIKINIEVMSSAEILKKISQNIPALGISLCRQEPKDVHRVFLLPQRYSLYCGKHHPLFLQESISKQDLVSENFVSFFSEQLGDVLSPLTIFKDKHQFAGEIVASSNNLDEIKRLIYAGFGIGCLPDSSMKREVLEGIYRKLPPEKGIVDVPIYLVWHKQRNLKPAEQVFIESLQAALQTKHNH